MEKSESKKPTLFLASIPILFLILLLSFNVYVFHFVLDEDTLAGSNQMVLLLASVVASVVALSLGFKWNVLLKGMIKSINTAMPSVIILLLIGALSGTWMLSGIVPAMIYYGLQILQPNIFLFAACIVCAVVSVSSGSSWSTIATVGIALLGIGSALGISEGLVAGAIISGAYFGDKMSPLSDTTNLAPAMAGTDLFTHIRYMAFTTVPSIVITLIIFLIIGFSFESQSSTTEVEEILSTIRSSFHVSGWLFIVPAGLIALIIVRVPAIPALLLATLGGGIFAIIFQPQMILQVAEGNLNTFQAQYVGVMKAMFGDITLTTSSESVNDLLSTGGMSGMLGTVWLIFCAMIFGGVLEAAGFLKTITSHVIRLANSTGSLIATTAGTCLFFNITASDQYLSIVVPGKMFSKTFKDRGLNPENLSRTLEDSGTVTSVLVPWNTCGATQAGILGVATLTYLPFCFFNIISPIMTIIFGIFGIKIRRIIEKKEPKSEMI